MLQPMEASCKFYRERGHGFGKEVAMAAIGAPETVYELLGTFLLFKISFGAIDLGKLGL